MPRCSVIGCGTIQRKNRPNLSFHILPKNHHKRKLWLDAIGVENLRCNTRNIYICSLHFDHSCYNYTMNVNKLKDDAVPSRTLLPTTIETRSSEILTEINPCQSTPNICEAPLAPAVESTSRNTVTKVDRSVTNICVTPDKVENVYFQEHGAYSVPGTSKDITLNLPPAVQTTSTNTITKVHRSVTNICVTPDKLEIPTLETVKKLKMKCNEYKRKIKTLNERVRRQKKRIAQFEIIVKDLKKHNLVNEENIVVLQECAGPKDFLKRQIAKSKGMPLERKYSEELRKFAVTLHFLSPKAYEFVRREYNTCLPHQRTLTKWYHNINAEPGFCQEAFEALKNKVEASNIPIVCALVFDEMSIRKSLCFDPNTKTYFGRVTVGNNDCDSEALEMASQCIVFMLVCINGSWKLPVGYFFVTSLTGDQKSILVQMCIQKCEELGAKVVSITCDGPATNFSMYATLGCNLTTNQELTNFTYGESNIYCFIDPCHAIKLIRNAFGELKLFRDIYGRDISYHYLELLQKLQESEGLHLATKLTKAHIMFLKQKMKVRLATQLLSNSVSEALDFCENKLKLKEFQGCAGTINFIKTMNDVFDVLNSRSMRPIGWKKAICPQNIGFVETLFEGAIGYIRNLKLPCGQLLIESKRKTGFLGLIIDMNSALQLYRYLVQDKHITNFLPLFKVSQDHVELFFSAIRARGGFNNNPTAVQFKAAFKRLLIKAEIPDSGSGNCIPLEQITILTCSSKDPIKSINDLSDKSSFAELPEDDSSLYEDFIDCLYNNRMSNYAENVVIYIGGFVARKLSRSLKCESCITLLFGDPKDYKSSLITLKNRGGLKYPSKDVVDVLKKTEKLIKSVLVSKKHPEIYYLYIFKFFIDYFSDSGNLFNSNDSHHDSNHKYLLIKSVIQTYMDLRFKYFGKKSSEKITFRNYLNKIVLFRNE